MDFDRSVAMTETNQILVVEDDPLVSEIIAAALDDTYPTTVVETAEAAMDRLRVGGIRLMLLDCTLPGGIGTDLLPEADRFGTAVVLMSGDPGRAQLLSDRTRPFLLKPFSLGSLMDMVAKVLAGTPPPA
jgi:DNA-binding NtrC family response regulator